MPCMPGHSSHAEVGRRISALTREPGFSTLPSLSPPNLHVQIHLIEGSDIGLPCKGRLPQAQLLPMLPAGSAQQLWRSLQRMKKGPDRRSQ